MDTVLAYVCTVVVSVAVGLLAGWWLQRSLLRRSVVRLQRDAIRRFLEGGSS
jgi:hypothetical protein